MKFYIINDDYVDFLKTIDSKVPDNKSEKRPFIGIVLEVNGHKYLAPLTSKNYETNKPTIVRMHDRRDELNQLGTILLNNMFPIIDTEVHLLDIDQQSEKYKNMLYKQLEFIKIKKAEIEKKAEKIYMIRKSNRNVFFIKNML